MENTHDLKTKNKVIYDDYDFFYFNDCSYFDLYENEFANKTYENQPKSDPNTETINQFSSYINNQKKKDNIKNQKNRNQNFFLNKLEKGIPSQYTAEIDLQRFIQYLNIKINCDKSKKITKDVLITFYNKIQNYLHSLPLTRAEKRDKIKIFQKLHIYSDNVIYCLEKMPEIFLNPAWIHLSSKIKKKKEKLTNKKKKKAKNEAKPF